MPLTSERGETRTITVSPLGHPGTRGLQPTAAALSAWILKPLCPPEPQAHGRLKSFTLIQFSKLWGDSVPLPGNSPLKPSKHTQGSQGS